MTLSMTGFASLRQKVKFSTLENPCEIEIEIKSLNSRFLECNLKIPMAFSSLEVEINDLLAKKLQRGKIFLLIKSGDVSPIQTKIKVNTALLQNYLAAIEELKKLAKITEGPRLPDLLRIEDIFITEKKDFLQKDKQAFLDLIKQAGDLLLKEREKEGSKISKDLLKILKGCQQHIARIAKDNEPILTKLKEQVSDMKNRLKTENPEASLLETALSNEHKKLAEVSHSLDKQDVHEEITRFGMHLQSAEQLLLNEKQLDKGKKLDFLSQEMFREVNTISAKTMSHTITTHCVNIKVELEKIREQVQNIV